MLPLPSLLAAAAGLLAAAVPGASGAAAGRAATGSVVAGIAAVQPAAAAPSGFASPMLDRTLFRDGAVTRSAERFGRWDVMCDELAALHRRFCSLHTSLDGEPSPVGAVVSTGDDGRPAALLHLPPGVALAPGIRTAAAPSTAEKAGAKTPKAKTRGAQRTVGVVSCTADDCVAVWTLSGWEIEALQKGGLTVTFCTPAAVSLEFSPSLRRSACMVEHHARVSNDGFAAAVAASLR